MAEQEREAHSIKVMCGIAGIANTFPTRQERPIAAVKRMMDRQTHRGPDDSGLYSDDHVVLGHRRLSIIDLSPAGRQPISNEDGTVWVVHNGEIYNYSELREDLINRGHVFRSQSDSEVLVHGFEEWGIEELLRRLIGMFAFAIYWASSKVNKQDLNKATLEGQAPDFQIILARDRLGQKPLYYAWHDRQLIFSSEVRAMMASGLLQNEINPSAVESFLMFGSVPTPFTMIKGVEALDAGHYLVVENGTSTLHKYWNLSFEPGAYVDEEDVREELQRKFEDSVRLRLVSDVPLGVFLSGGIDSGAIVATMRRVTSQNINSFSLTFAESKYDEGDLAKQVAKKFQTQHFAFKTGAREVFDELPKFFDSMDQPTIDGLNTYFVSKVTREAGTIVALSGVGGDELFGGYPSFQLAPRLYRYSRVGHSFPFIKQIVNFFLAQYLPARKLHKLRILMADQPSIEAAYLAVRGIFLREEMSNEVRKVTGEKIPRVFAALEYLKGLSKCCGEAELFNKVSCLEIRSYLHNQLLRDTDMMGMAHALEIRVPFLDHRLVEFMAQVPVIMKAGQSPKSLLLKTVAANLPQEIFKHSKMGFTLPFDSWFRSDWKDHIQQCIIADPLQIQGLQWDPLHLWNRFLDGKLHWSRIWAVVVLKEWLKRNKVPESMSAGKF